MASTAFSSMISQPSGAVSPSVRRASLPFFLLMSIDLSSLAGCLATPREIY